MSLDELKNGTVSELTNKPENNYTSILVLRELESNAVFTTNGVDADIGTIAIEDSEYNPVLMFMRKQSGSDRRYGKSMQRELLEDVECTMNVNEMCQKCPECVLFGSAASEGDYDISITSRVMYDTAYSLRDSNVVVEEKFQNAPGDSYSKKATAGIREPDFVLPGTMFPCVITLRDATPEELAFVLAITLKNKRYGATSSRQGRTKNHILGIYQGNEEPASNLAITKKTINKLGDANEITKRDTISIDKAKKAVKQSFDEILKQEKIDMEEIDNTKDILNEVRENIGEYLKNQKEVSNQFIENQVN